MTIDNEQLERALALRDLSDPAEGEHAIQHVLATIENALATAWAIPVHRDRGSRIVKVADNYDRMRYDLDATTRDRRYTRYLGDGRMLRSHTSARIPGLLAEHAAGGRGEVLYSIPGLCYRRDVIDRQHVGEPHQLDLWRIRPGLSGQPGQPGLTESDLVEMIDLVIGAVLPGRSWYTVPNRHPYTLAGREIYVRAGGEEIEVGECGLAHPDVLTAAGLPDGATGLAMGLGLDRLTMLVKGIDDIRLLRSADPRVAAQMRDLRPYRPVSAMPAVHRDLSLAVAEDLDPELLGDRVRAGLGAGADTVEEVIVRGETGYDQLPQAARDRMGISPGQKNVLVRVVLRDHSRTLTDTEANELRDRIYAALHEGTAHEWAVTA